MNLNEGASHEINSRWPEHKQRNSALIPNFYSAQYTANMSCGIKLVVDIYHELNNNGATVWSIDKSDSDTLDNLAGI